MLSKDNLISNMHKIFRDDLWLQEIFKSGGNELDTLKSAMAELEKQYNFKTISLEFLPFYEKLLAIKTNPLNSIEDRRSFVEAKWKSDSKADLKLIQAVCNSWRGGVIAVTFPNGKIQIKFNGLGGVPSDLKGLELAIDDVKPSHLPIRYIFMYLYWNLFESWNLTWDGLESKNLTWDNLESKVTN
ncbi:putative phage tail protein [Clostridium sp. CF012]|uniref:putative phage tail protein n=1 Tax=Clostridium sp. CF012 TaxID=2843319 RepID=UPI001C0D836D|nr:putative phage tail protein [Clostridium sp. CF012]MBU3146902.1 YmfQ family protein [Clostridium sp. CF012]